MMLESNQIKSNQIKSNIIKLNWRRIFLPHRLPYITVRSIIIFPFFSSCELHFPPSLWRGTFFLGVCEWKPHLRKPTSIYIVFYSKKNFNLFFLPHNRLPSYPILYLFIIITVVVINSIQASCRKSFRNQHFSYQIQIKSKSNPNRMSHTCTVTNFVW